MGILGLMITNFGLRHGCSFCSENVLRVRGTGCGLTRSRLVVEARGRRVEVHACL